MELEEQARKVREEEARRVELEEQARRVREEEVRKMKEEDESRQRECIRRGCREIEDLKQSSLKQQCLLDQGCGNSRQV